MITPPKHSVSDQVLNNKFRVAGGVDVVEGLVGLMVGVIQSISQVQPVCVFASHRSSRPLSVRWPT